MSQELRQALTLLVELAELEMECPACPNPPEGFHNGLRQATKVTRQFLSEIRPDPGEFFISPQHRPRAGRPSSQIINR